MAVPEFFHRNMELVTRDDEAWGAGGGQTPWLSPPGTDIRSAMGDSGSCRRVVRGL